MIISTSGDKFQQTSFSQIGGKGVFIKELEDALLEARVDLAVHSMKDVPTELPAGLMIAAICKREDVRDALVSSQWRDAGGAAAGRARGHQQPAPAGAVAPRAARSGDARDSRKRGHAHGEVAARRLRRHCARQSRARPPGPERKHHRSAAAPMFACPRRGRARSASRRAPEMPRPCALLAALEDAETAAR